MPGIITTGNNELISSDELLTIINQARKEYGERAVRNNDFILRVKDELDGEYYEIFVVDNPNGTKSEKLIISRDQASLVGMRESKAVRRSVLAKLKERFSQEFNLPKTLPEALRFAAVLAEEKQELVNQLALAAPKVDFANRVAEASGVLIGNFAKTVGIGPNKLFSWLRGSGILIAGGSRRNVPMQEYMNRGYFTLKETPVETNHGVHISFTAKITGKGQQWLTRKLLDAGMLRVLGDAA